MNPRRVSITCSVVAVLAAALGFWAGNTVEPSVAQERSKTKAAASLIRSSPADEPGDAYLRQSPAATASGREFCDYGLGPNHVSKLPAYPPGKAGDRTPF